MRPEEIAARRYVNGYIRRCFIDRTGDSAEGLREYIERKKNKGLSLFNPVEPLLRLLGREDEANAVRDTVNLAVNNLFNEIGMLADNYYNQNRETIRVQQSTGVRGGLNSAKRVFENLKERVLGAIGYNHAAEAQGNLLAGLQLPNIDAVIQSIRNFEINFHKFLLHGSHKLASMGKTKISAADEAQKPAVEAPKPAVHRDDDTSGSEKSTSSFAEKEKTRRGSVVEGMPKPAARDEDDSSSSHSERVTARAAKSAVREIMY